MPKPTIDKRQRLTQLIHIAKGQLKMAEESYRAILANEGGGKTSSSDLTIPQLERVLEHMKRCGFKVRTKAKPKGATKPAKAQSSRPLAQDAESKKIRALWLLLSDMGVVKNSSEEALAAYVKRVAKVDALQWVNGEQAATLIESLKKWAMRFLPEQVYRMAQELETSIEACGWELRPEKIAELRYLVGRAQARQTFEPMQSAWVELSMMFRKDAQ